MSAQHPLLIIIPLRDVIKRIVLDSVVQSSVIEVQDVMELLIVMWLRDRHFAIHGDYLGNVNRSVTTLEDRIKAEIIEVLVIDYTYLDEPTHLSNVIRDVALLLFSQLEQLLPVDSTYFYELPNVRINKWLAHDVVIELFE